MKVKLLLLIKMVFVDNKEEMQEGEVTSNNQTCFNFLGRALIFVHVALINSIK